MFEKIALGLATAGLVLLAAAPLLADGGVTFRDLAADPASGIDYRRAPSLSKAIFDAIKEEPFDFGRLADVPMKARGLPGVAIFDYDRDGDLDVYVTNGPGRANSLYSNQLRESGETVFVDVAVEAGVDATDLDATGVCFGDLDNDGDHDLLVLSHNGLDRLYENLGGGADGVVTFTDISAASGINVAGVRSSSGCSMGDVDGDGLLDIAIGNSFETWDNFRGVNREPFILNQHNQLFLNEGGNVFTDVSVSSGVEDLDFAPPGPRFPLVPDHPAGLTWALALVDFDRDGDVDLFNADDQGGIPTIVTDGVNRGTIHLLENDGTGRFTERTFQSDLARTGAWMGLSFGDYNCDGALDFFVTNYGDYVPFSVPEPGRQPSRWFLGSADGVFTDPGVGDLVTTPFGWGTSSADYDNDGDVDILFHGGLDVGPAIEASTPAALFQNQGCEARFVYDADAFAGSADHTLRTVQGMAMGDLDDDGFVDVVSASNFNLDPALELTPHTPLGSPFDAGAKFFLSFTGDPLQGGGEWVKVEHPDGTLAVELSSADNGNGWIKVRLLGAVGLIDGGRVNRDGIGALVSVFSDATPEPGTTRPVTGGSSHASQDALELVFGLGAAAEGTVEVLWPGGVRNRVYGVRAGERLLVPEVPCSFDDPDLPLRAYLGCVLHALDDLVEAAAIEPGERARLLLSALKARRDAQGAACAVDAEIGEDFLGADLLKEAVFEPLGPEGGVTFRDIAQDEGSGIDYRRRPSASKAIFDAIKDDPPYTIEKANMTPLKSWGVPGVAVLDVDSDGDLDLYVTNGPGAPNSLYSNQLVESGRTTFVDVGQAAGVGAVDQDSTGVCFGDTDNDGDPDLLVLSHNSPHRFFENQGGGADGFVTFLDVSATAGFAAAEVRAASGCSWGDVDGDGLLDVAIANSYDNWDHNLGLNVERFALNQHNQLYLNQGGNVFADVSAASGIEDLDGLPLNATGAAGLTWALALADVDLDGDVDLVTGDDQSGFPTFFDGGVDRGLLRVHRNDGTGSFEDVTLSALGRKPGAWMGLAFGDFNCDLTLDFFATNFGDYNPFVPQPPGRRASRWFLGKADGSFEDPGVGDLVTTPFGWGVSTLDYDNDGDLDVVFYGGMDVGPAIDAANAGVLLRNPGCTAEFVYEDQAFAGSADHGRRNEQGSAVGDLDRDGFVDVVSVSNFDIPEDVELMPHAPLGSPFDPTAFFHFNFAPEPKTEELVWVGSTFDPGTLAVELSSGGNGNRSFVVRTLGGKDLVRGGRVNRDGIGAVVAARVLDRQPARWTARPVVGGSSYASQDALEAHFGLGTAERAVVDVTWPGGVKNRLYNVKAGERLVFPEIPCSYDDGDVDLVAYTGCLLDAFDDLVAAGAIGPGERPRFLTSAFQARNAALKPDCDGEGSLLVFTPEELDAP